jgi:F0F1-type ATP synthase membrane subunit b/b'
MRRIFAALLVIVCIALAGTHAYAANVVVWKEATMKVGDKYPHFDAFITSMGARGLVVPGGFDSVETPRFACSYALAHERSPYVSQFRQLLPEQQEYAVTFCGIRFVSSNGWSNNWKKNLPIPFAEFSQKGSQQGGFPMPFLQEVLDDAREEVAIREGIARVQQQVVALAPTVSPQDLAGLRNQLLTEIGRLERLLTEYGQELDSEILALREDLNALTLRVDKHDTRLDILESWKDDIERWKSDLPENFENLGGLLETWEWFEDNWWWLKWLLLALALLLLGWLLYLTLRKPRVQVIDNEARRIANNAANDAGTLKNELGNTNQAVAVLRNDLAGVATTVAALTSDARRHADDWQKDAAGIKHRLDNNEARLTKVEENTAIADRRSIKALALAREAKEIAYVAFSLGANKNRIEFDWFPEDRELWSLKEGDDPVTYIFVQKGKGVTETIEVTVRRGPDEEVNGERREVLFVKGTDERGREVPTTVANFRGICCNALYRRLSQKP